MDKKSKVLFSASLIIFIIIIFVMTILIRKFEKSSTYQPPREIPQEEIKVIKEGEVKIEEQEQEPQIEPGPLIN